MQLVYLSPIPAGSYAQRPHYMVRAWLALGAESVLWVNPYPTRLPRWEDLFRRPGMHEQGTVMDSRVEVLNVPALPIEPLPGGPEAEPPLVVAKNLAADRGIRRPWRNGFRHRKAERAGVGRAAGDRLCRQFFRCDGQLSRVSSGSFAPVDAILRKRRGRGSGCRVGVLDVFGR